MGDESDSLLRGEDLTGAERIEAAEHVARAKRRNPDTELHLDGEKDTLYADGLDVQDDTLTLADTKGMSHRG